MASRDVIDDVTNRRRHFLVGSLLHTNPPNRLVSEVFSRDRNTDRYVNWQ